MPGHGRDVHEVVDLHGPHGLPHEAASAPAQNHDSMDMLMAFERGMPAFFDLEIAKLAAKTRILEQDLPGDVSERRAALLLIFEKIDAFPAKAREAFAEMRRIGR